MRLNGVSIVTVALALVVVVVAVDSMGHFHWLPLATTINNGDSIALVTHSKSAPLVAGRVALRNTTCMLRKRWSSKWKSSGHSGRL